MLFRVGVAMMLFSVAVVVAAWVGLSRLGEDSAQRNASLEPLAAGVGRRRTRSTPAARGSK